MKILYFTSDFSEQNIEFAQQHGLTMRNAAAHTAGGSVETCDAWFGEETPAEYREAFAEHTLAAETVPLADYQALQAQLAAAQQRIAELEAAKPAKSAKPEKQAQ